MKYHIIILSYLICNYSIAQKSIAGYMGKRMSINYSVSFHPSIELLNNANSVNNPNEGISLSYFQTLDLNYIVATRSSIELGVQYSKMPLGMPPSFIERYEYKGKTYPATFHSKGITIGFKLYSKKTIAPIGSYVKWNILILNNTLNIDSNNTYKIESTSGQPTLTPVVLNSNTINSWGGGISISFGKQRVLFNRLVTDFGVRLALAIDPYHMRNYTTDYDTYNLKYERIFKVNNRLFYNQIINLRLGLGFLAF